MNRRFRKIFGEPISEERLIHQMILPKQGNEYRILPGIYCNEHNLNRKAISRGVPFQLLINILARILLDEVFYLSKIVLLPS